MVDPFPIDVLHTISDILHTFAKESEPAKIL
jgi:hypothetical protein